MDVAITQRSGDARAPIASCDWMTQPQIVQQLPKLWVFVRKLIARLQTIPAASQACRVGRLREFFAADGMTAAATMQSLRAACSMAATAELLSLTEPIERRVRPGTGHWTVVEPSGCNGSGLATQACLTQLDFKCLFFDQLRGSSGAPNGSVRLTLGNE